MELCSMFCAILDGSGVWRRMDTCICMAESPCHSSETITLLISFALKQKFKKTETHFQFFSQLMT